MHSQLILTHSWGGGVEKWTRDFVANDRRRRNLVLKSWGYAPRFGRILELYDGPCPHPVERWALKAPIASTAHGHEEYSAILADIIERHGIGAVIIASLIGHSLDALRTGLPAAVLFHDYYPVCPAFNITFGGACAGCDDQELIRCHEENPWTYLHEACTGEEMAALRREFIGAVACTRPLLAAPSESVFTNLARLAPGLLDGSPRKVIPHGTAPLDESRPGDHGPWPLRKGERMRVIIPGTLTPQKGAHILAEIMGDALIFTDLYLAGGGRTGQFSSRPGLHILGSYDNSLLPGIVMDVKPHLCLLPSAVPETYGYALSELSALNVPCLATRMGAFEERIQDGVNGFLAGPDGKSLLAAMKRLAENPEALGVVGENLRSGKYARGIAEMITAYHEAIEPLDRTADETGRITARKTGSGSLRLALFWIGFHSHRVKRRLLSWLGAAAGRNQG